ncbi:hypothetical protein ACGFR6_27530 [Streptomyces sp. NPDC048567]|uniref:hypothetical protein n=1 Tax=Streptomyces sp. NPDC048567 TaxID=3365570 RepID=UPI0037218774
MQRRLAADEDIFDAEIVEPGRMDWVKEKAAPHKAKAKVALAGLRTEDGFLALCDDVLYSLRLTDSDDATAY